jgi:hypothetical protein
MEGNRETPLVKNRLPIRMLSPSSSSAARREGPAHAFPLQDYLDRVVQIVKRDDTFLSQIRHSEAPMTPFAESWISGPEATALYGYVSRTGKAVRGQGWAITEPIGGTGHGKAGWESQGLRSHPLSGTPVEGNR